MTRSIKLTEEQLDLLYCGLRYLELKRPTKDIKQFPHENYRQLFRDLFNNIIAQQNQERIFQ